MANRGGATGGPPDLHELRATLRRREPFSAESVSDRACSVAPTFGEYLALLERFGEPVGSVPSGVHELKGGCREFPTELRGVDPPASPDYWFCTIDSYARDGEDPWSYSLVVRVRKADRAPDLATAACPGA